jgi:hypothetical protein
MEQQRPVHRTIVVFDVEGFGDTRRTNRDQVSVREGLYRAVGDAFQQAGLPWDADACEDRGDGIFVLIPPEVPKSLLVESLPSALAAALSVHNDECPGEQRIRLRMALHAGEVNYDDHGVTAAAVNLTFRLVEAEALKAALAGSPGVLAVIVSSWFFDEVVRHIAADAAARYRAVPVSVKETVTTGWICLPSHPASPGEAGRDGLSGGSSWPEVFASVPESPYKGLRAFEGADRDLFFGRASVVQELVRAVATRALVPVVGASGVGKSSVVHAGLLPRLEEHEAGWGFVSVRPRPTLMLALAAGLARLSGSAVPVPVADLEAWQERLSRLGLARAAQLACTGSGRERVLVTVDQFEEVLAQESEVLLAQLADLPDDGTLTAVLTLREDSFGAFFVRHASFGERLRRSAVALRGMDRGELEEVVRVPAALRGVRIADPLVGELVSAVLDRPGALPLLEFSLDQMWRTLRPGQHVLSFDAYEAIGRLDGALAAHADKVLDGLTDPEQGVARNLFVNHLTSAERPEIRQVLRRSDCAPGDWQIIVRLAGERLVTISRDDDGNQTAEVVHEALLRAWDQLRGWLDAERPFRSWRQVLRDEMAPWADSRETGVLLTGALLATSERWLGERPADLSLDERRFIEMSLTRRAEEEHRYQVLYQRSLARTLSHAAEAADDPVLAVLLAIEVIERAPDAQADRLIRACLNRLGAPEVGMISREAGPEAVRRLRQRLTVADWSRQLDPGGRWVLGGPGASLVVDERGRVRYGTEGVIAMPGPVVAAACTQAGVVVLGTEAGELAVWQLADRAEKVSGRDLGVPVMCLAVSDTAQTLVAACDDGVIRVLRGEDVSDMALLPCPGFVRDIDVSAGRLVAALSHDRRVRVWDQVSQARVCESVTGIGASRLAIDPGEDHVIVGDAVTGGDIGRFPLSTRALTAWARQAAGRQLTPAERRRYIDDPLA